ncbi:MAG: 3D domain-containing protein [Thiolinea sp.]
MAIFTRFCTVLLLLAIASPAAIADKKGDNRLRVTATAYNSLPAQTDSTPNIAAWGDRLRPGMKVIAVSRDLLKKYGLKHKDKVKISGLDGEYQVLDKMNKRWRKKIDIYMGKDRRKALRWGRKNVTIRW